MAQISDNDAIYTVLDQLNNDGQYEKVLETIEGIPSEAISNKLWFAKIRALIDLKCFKEARTEISLLSKRCSEPSEDAMLYYLLGNTFECTGCTLKAVECYRHTQEFDPGFDNIQSLIDACLEAVNGELDNAAANIKNLIADAAKFFAETKEKRELIYPESSDYISMIESSFLPTGMGFELPLDKPFYECEDEVVREKIRIFLDKKYGVSDLKSLQQWYGNGRIAPTVDGVRHALENNIPMPVEKMSISEITYFESVQLVLKYMMDLLPGAGIAAWDYNEVIALARLAYAAGIITRTEFCETTLFFTDECVRNYSSWEDVMRSVIVGGFINCMMMTQYDVKNAAMFGTVACGMCKENYSKVKWIEN